MVICGKDSYILPNSKIYFTFFEGYERFVKKVHKKHLFPDEAF